MSGENPTATAEDPPPLVNGESASSHKNDAEKYGSEENREAAVTSNDANEVKSGCQNGTECAADEGTNVVETDDTNEANSGSANLVGAVDVKMVDTQHECIIEGVDVKMVETQHEASIEAVVVKLVETQHEASIEAVDVKLLKTQHEANIEAMDVKMVETKYEANIEAEDAKVFGSKHEAVIEAEDVKMVDAQREANIEAKDVKMVVTQDVEMVDTQHEANIDAGEDASQVKEGLNGDNHYAKTSGGEDTEMIEAKADTRNSMAQENRKPEKEDNTEAKTNHASGIKMAEKEDVCQKEDKEGKNEDNQDAKVAEADETNKVEAKVDARNAEAQGNGKKGEMEDKMEEKGNNGNIEDDVKTFGNEDACQKEVIEGDNEDRQDARASEGDEIKMVEAKTDAGNEEVEGDGKKEDEAGQTEEKKNNASTETEELKMPDKEYAYEEEDTNLKNEDIQDGRAADGEDMKSVEGKTDAEIAEVIECREKGEVEFKADQKNDAYIEAENVIMVDKGNACQTEDNVRKNDDNQDANLAECEDKTVDAGNAVVKETKRKETKEEHNVEKGNVLDVQTDVKIVDEEDACLKEDKERKTEDSHGAKAAEAEGIMMAESKSLAVHAEVKENGQKEEDGNKTEEKQIICMEKQDEDKMEPAEEQKGEKQDAKLNAEEKDKTHDGKVFAEKEEEEEEVNENITSEKNGVGVIERGNTTADKQQGKKDNQMDDICKHEGQNKGTKRSNADIEESENRRVSKMEKDGEATVEQAGESIKNVEENKNGEPKSKKARIVTEKDHGKDKKQDGSKSREAKNLLSTPSPYSLDRPTRARKTVERLVEVIEKEQGGDVIVEKGRGTPLKNIPGVARRISNKKPAELKFLHQILFGRLGKAVDFKSHILEFSGFVWHESDEKRRARAKEKLDKCSIETLLDLCNLLVVPVSRDDIVAKLLDFIAEPKAKDDSTLSDDQRSNSRKRKREAGRKKLDDEHTSRKRSQTYSESESDEDAEEGPGEDDHMKSDIEENKDDGEEVDSEQEDRHGWGKVKAGKKSVDGKGSTAKTKRKGVTGISPKTAPVATLSKCASRVSSSLKSCKDKQRSAVDLNVVSGKSKPITPKRTTNSEKGTNEKRSSGKGSTSKGKSAEAEQAPPSKDELQKTIVQLLKKVDFDNVTFSDILKMLDKHYKTDVSSMKDTVKSIILDELVKLAEADED